LQKRTPQTSKEYLLLRLSYFGYRLADYGTFDTELVSKIIYDLKRGKPPDISGFMPVKYKSSTSRINSNAK